MHGHGAGVDVLRAAPHALQQLFARKHLFRMTRQQIQHVELFGGQLDWDSFTVTTRLVGSIGQIAQRQRSVIPRLGLLPSETPHHRPDTAHQLLRAERLDHVIVRAHFEPGDAVDLLAARCQHDDRHIGTVTQPAGKAKDRPLRGASSPG
ncbi:MAG: hypothetical protein MZV64_59205 [Ignavibacteriales bacterium]|nr:hypothetical protein [Ignavibacteriales bacterium]